MLSCTLYSNELSKFHFKKSYNDCYTCRLSCVVYINVFFFEKDNSINSHQLKLKRTEKSMLVECNTYIINYFNKENSINVKDMFYQFWNCYINCAKSKKKIQNFFYLHTASLLLFDQLCKAAQFCMVNGSTFKKQEDYIIISRVVCLLQTNI